MRILVTGGAGFIGSHVVDACIREGHEVAVVDNLSTGLQSNVHTEAKLYPMDILDKALADVFNVTTPEVVIHLAAQASVVQSLQDPILDARINVLGSLAVLENCVRHRPHKLIFSSTGGAVYGNPSLADLPVSEAYPPRPRSPYGTSKLCVEHYIQLYGTLHDVRYTVLRFPNVYGPRQNPHGEAGVCSILLGLMLNGQRPTLYGFGKPKRDYVYVEDIARACVLALRKGDGAVLNLGSGEGTSVEQVYRILKRLSVFAGEAVRKPLRAGEVNDIYITNAKALESLGWYPEVSLEEGLKRTCDWVKTQ